ncbi:MAG: ABC transporter substrate-binding protein [Pseudomonadota bacterium]
MKITSFLKQRQSSLAAAMLSVFLLLACSSHDKSGGEERASGENVLRYDVNAPFTSLNPAEIDFSGSTHVFPLLYSYLCVPNAKGELEPDLAESRTYNPGTRTWTIRLRRDARFHDGSPVLSGDVLFSFNTQLKRLCPDLFGQIDRISLPSDSELLLTLRRDDPEFLKKVWQMEIIPRSSGKCDFYNHPTGSGPFRFKSRKEDREIVLEANPDYFGGRPSLDRVVFWYQPDKEKAWARLLSDHTDIAQELSPRNYRMMQAHGDRYYFDLYPLNYYTVLLYNTADRRFSDPRVRLALSYAVDREFIVRDILGGFGKVAAFLPESRCGSAETEPVAAYNPGKALALLREAGWASDESGHWLRKNGKPFDFTILLFDEHKIEKKVAAYLQLCLSDIGIRTLIKALPFKELAARYCRNTEFQTVMTEFRGGSCSELLCRNPEDSQAEFSDRDEFSRLARGAGFKRNREKPEIVEGIVNESIASSQPAVFLFQKTAIDAMSKRFSLSFPFSLTYQGIYHLKDISLKHRP